MRWSIIRLIWLRELRDQLRDRRTVVMILGLPLLLYPLLGFAVIRFAEGFVGQPSVVGIARPAGTASSDFPARLPPGAGLHPAPPLAWLTVVPAAPALPTDQVIGAAVLSAAGHTLLDYPLFVQDGQLSAPVSQGLDKPGSLLRVVLVDQPTEALREKKIDVLLSVPSNFMVLLDQGERPAVNIELRDDDRSRQAAARVSIILGEWQKRLKEVRLARHGLVGYLDDLFEVRDISGTAPRSGGRGMLDLMVRIFPFMLVMWALAGALYPAVDLCAGEKERGTMETLLISPAAREEIVLGKFLTIWVFSAGTALLNLTSIGLTTWQFADRLTQGGLNIVALLWCVLLLVPLSAFFSAVCLAIGAYARSTKEGQYYLMPLFLITMPLIFLTLAPGVEFNPFYSMVPVTGVGLLMQRLMTASSAEQVPWFYFAPVLAPIVLYSWLALRWAVEQFQREEVLFREAERLDPLLWLRRLFRDKEPMPTTGQALFCFGLLLLLRWLSLDLGAELPLSIRNTIVTIAFLAAPPLFMALLLTTQPRRALNLYWPRPAFILAALLLLPLAEASLHVLLRFPALLHLLETRQTFVQEAYDRLREIQDPLPWSLYLLALAVVPAVCKEIAFRGLILTGLQRRFATWPAILLSSFLFAAYHMNVFALAPGFALGVILGVLAVRSGSLLPGILLHSGCVLLQMAGPLLRLDASAFAGSVEGPVFLSAALACAALAAAVLRYTPAQKPA